MAIDKGFSPVKVDHGGAIPMVRARAGTGTTFAPGDVLSVDAEGAAIIPGSAGVLPAYVSAEFITSATKNTRFAAIPLSPAIVFRAYADATVTQGYLDDWYGLNYTTAVQTVDIGNTTDELIQIEDVDSAKGGTFSGTAGNTPLLVRFVQSRYSFGGVTAAI